MVATLLERVAGAQELGAELEELVGRVRESVVLVRGSRNGAGSGVVWLLDEFMDRFRRRVEGDVERDESARRLWILIDFFHAALRGVPKIKG